jgi:hypothetical protein
VFFGAAYKPNDISELLVNDWCALASVDHPVLEDVAFSALASKAFRDKIVFLRSDLSERLFNSLLYCFRWVSIDF